MAAIQESTEMKRLREKVSIEVLWMYILKLLMEEPLHAYALRKKIMERFGFLPGNVTAYVVLYKLKARGFVRTDKKENKTIYYITSEGGKLFAEGKKEFQKIMKKLF